MKTRRHNPIAPAALAACLLCAADCGAGADGPAAEPARELGEHAAEAWQRSYRRMVEILRLQKQKASLPKRAWIKRDRRDVDDDINALLGDVLEVLHISPLTDLRREYAELGERITRLKTTVRELSEARLTAADRKSVLGFFKLTRKGYTRKIEKTETEIAALEAQQREMVEKLRDEYARMGLPLTTEQVRFYLASVSGRDIIALSAVFDNVRALSEQLESLMLDNQGDPEAVRRYYGIHVVLIRTVVKAHEVTLANIRDRYLARIADLAEHNDAIRSRTEALLEDAMPEGERRILESNLEAQATTDEALAIYREHLETTRARIARALEAVRTRHAVARNAYETISIASALAAEMETAIENLSGLRSLHLPDLVPFNNDAIQQRFTEITESLEQSYP